MGSISTLSRSTPAEQPYWAAVGLCERAAAVVLFACALPVTLVSAILIRSLSGRTPLIAHRRVGRSGAPLWMLKLRTMWDSTAPPLARAGWIEYIADDAGPGRKIENDPRVPNRFAQFLRRHSLDELPQLWHVIGGEMSLVGPRPLTTSELRQYYGAHADEVLRVRPGLAGLWQISGRNRLSYSERRNLDLKFVRQRSIAMYFTILLRTVPEVLLGRNSW